MQYLFLNGRHIRDRALQHALGEAYRGMLMVGRHPVCFLRMDMPAEMIDVNVHPTKLEVRFTDGGRIYSRLLQTLRHHFLTSDMTHQVAPPTTNDQPVEEAGSNVAPLNSSSAQQRQEVIDWARSGVSTVSNVPPKPIADFQPFSDSAHQPNRGPSLTPATTPDENQAPWEQDETTNPVDSPSVCYLGFQVHNRYLVTQDDSGMVVIDQHALHERVLYERVCQKVLNEGTPLESQRLLVPEPVSLTPAERTAALDARESLGKIGMEIDDFGGESILIHSYPAMLKNKPPAEMLRTVLEALMSAGKRPDPKDLLNHLLSTIACKAAVKAGDPLSAEEITSLLEQKDLYHDTHHCPHGRPTALFFSRDELDRMFGRLGPRGRLSPR